MLQCSNGYIYLSVYLLKWTLKAIRSKTNENLWETAQIFCSLANARVCVRLFDQPLMAWLSRLIWWTKVINNKLTHYTTLYSKVRYKQIQRWVSATASFKPIMHKMPVALCAQLTRHKTMYTVGDLCSQQNTKKSSALLCKAKTKQLCTLMVTAVLLLTYVSFRTVACCR